MKKRFIIFLAVMLLAGVTASASEESVRSLTLYGSVAPGEAVRVTAPYGGVLGNAFVEQGAVVESGDALFQLEPTKIYAPSDGVVRMAGVKPGDDAKALTDKYGAVMVIEPPYPIIQADTASAYDSKENKTLHIGETVYAVCRSNNERTAVGFITKISGKKFTVEITSGTLLADDDVYVYRSESHVSSSRIGGGSASRDADVQVAGDGGILRTYVKLGDTVKRGDLLFETASFQGSAAPEGDVVAAPGAAIVGAVDMKAGQQVTAGQTLATLYPLSGLVVSVEIGESDLSRVSVGDAVTLEYGFGAYRSSVPGTVQSISGLNNGGSEDVHYSVSVAYDDASLNREGMSVAVIIN